ncbi:MAG: PAS domain S-box protein [Chloroflexaceae bacterium]|nr:PAS domain S-box protein [Chloroflexaceae bacterium]
MGICSRHQRPAPPGTGTSHLQVAGRICPGRDSVSDTQGIFVYTNPSYQEMTGYGEAMIGMPVMSLYNEAIDVSAIIGEVMTRGRWQGVLPFIRKDESVFQGQASIYLIEDPEQGRSLLAAIVRDITEQQRVEGELTTFKTLVDNAPDGINVTTLDARIFYANASFRRMSGYEDETIGKTIVDLYADEPAALMAAARQVADEGFFSGNFTLQQPDGTLVPIACNVFSILDAQGSPRWLAAIVRDISEQQRQEQEREELQQRIIEAQRVALRELSTPLLPLADGVLVMPLLGTIDSNRAQQVMETLLEGVSTYQSHTAILDITGVQMVDTQVANALIHTAQAVKLLGSQVVLTGIRPAMAQTLVNLGADLGGIVTRSTLESGIAYALGK